MATRSTVPTLPDGVRSWSPERILFLLAGSTTVLSPLLAAVVSPCGNRPSSWLLQRYPGFQRGSPR
jgi:hypothetical protein